jgi:ribosome-binding protein aMBF1 (putative translation factor)
MSAQHDKPTSQASALAVQVHAARVRSAFSIETLAALAQVDPEAIAALEKGDAIKDMAAWDRVMDVLGLRPDSHR